MRSVRVHLLPLLDPLEALEQHGFVSTWMMNYARTPKRNVGYSITDTWGTNEIYMRLDDAQDERLLMSGEGNADYSARTADRDCSLASSRQRLTGTACGGTDTDEDSIDTVIMEYFVKISLKARILELKRRNMKKLF
ncbi:hypothetical protein Tco_0175632 [Tanacetum coccineum]